MAVQKYGLGSRAVRRPGRPRDPEVETRVLGIALRKLGERGYSRLSLDEIATEAGVSKPTIYRRWSGKAGLATEALRSLQLSEPLVATGTTTGDLAGILQNFRRSLLRPNGMALIGTILAEENHTPELLSLFRERIAGPRRKLLRLVLERARRRGELRGGIDLDAAVNLLVGAFYAHYLANPRISPAYPRQLVSTVWDGLRRRGVRPRMA